MASQVQQVPPSNVLKQTREYFQEHPFTVTLGIWGGIMVGTGAYLWTRKIPLQLKIIQARILAQSGLIFGAITIGVITELTRKKGEHTPATSNWKVRSFDLPVAAAQGNNTAPADEAHAAAVVSTQQLK